MKVPMKYSRIWWILVSASLLVSVVPVSFLAAQTEEPSVVNAPSSAGAQSDSAEAQLRSDEPTTGARPPKNRDIAPATDVEIERRFNELRSELLDAREKMTDWWLVATAIFLTLLSVVIVGLGYFGSKRHDKIESEAREKMEASKQHAEEAQRYKEEAQRYVEETKASRDEHKSMLEKQKAESSGNGLYEANEVKRLDGSLGRAVAAAMSFEQQNKIEEAIEKWRSIANIIEETDADLAAEAWLKTGQLLSSKSVDDEDWEGAVEAYDKAIKLNPNLMVAYHNRGNARFNLGQYRQAMADFCEAIKRNPDYAEAYYNRGNARFNLGQYRQAIADYSEAIKRNPDDAEAYNNRGNARRYLGRDEQAMADFCEAIKRNPDYALAYYNRGMLEVTLDLMDEAQQDFQTALNLIQREDDIDTDLLARVLLALENLDRGDAP